MPFTLATDSARTTLMKILIVSFLMISASAQAATLSGTVAGLSIPNSHVVTQTESQQVFRGRAPTNKQMQELLDLGVRQFVIFKNDVRGEVTQEIADLKRLGVPAENIKSIPFPWKDIRNFKEVCEMTITALQTIENATAKGESIFFHCTAGEDRTGYLASLWTLWSGAKTSARESFKQDMCAHGYEAGNPHKPYREVVAKIRETLTPTYQKMLLVLKEARAQNQELDLSMCGTEPTLPVNITPFSCGR
jgi:hypothetical protein